MDTRGAEIEDWMVERNLILIINPEDPPTFYSRRWKSQSAPIIAIATEDNEQFAMSQTNLVEVSTNLS